MTSAVQLEAPVEARSAIEPLLQNLAKEGVERVEVFSYCRPGEQRYWMAFIFLNGRRITCGTPDIRNVPLDEQLHSLSTQLQGAELQKLLAKSEVIF